MMTITKEVIAVSIDKKKVTRFKEINEKTGLPVSVQVNRLLDKGMGCK